MEAQQTGARGDTGLFTRPARFFGDREQQEAFTAIFSHHERRIYALSYRMLGDPDDAADLTQETFLKAYHAFAAFEAGEEHNLGG